MDKEISNKYGFKHFYFFQRTTPDLILELGRKNPVASTVYLLLLHCSSNIGCCEVSQPDIAKFVHKSVRTVARAINYLATHCYIAIAHSGRANVYVLNFNQVWGTYSYKKSTLMKRITFPTNVVIKRDKQNAKFFSKLDSFTHNHVNKLVNVNNMKLKHVKPNKYFMKKAQDRKVRAKSLSFARILKGGLVQLRKNYHELKQMENAHPECKVAIKKALRAQADKYLVDNKQKKPVNE